MEAGMMEIVRSLNRSWIYDTYFSLYRLELFIREKCPGRKCPGGNVRIPHTCRSMMKCFFFKVSVVSYVFLYADFWKNTQTILAHTVLTEIENLCMERVRPGEKVYFANVSSRLSYFPETLDTASE